ncbi:MAG TPA: fucose isomerase [Phycisphaerae bacterium]|nr:fucose isomerase [Phycisphaerae bacterium]HRY67378.1 fucose isomerase [Phycisphaerae bacterium]HSA29330.1 fucose isomerase [Phycisphaerae bacterium]
MSSYKLPRLAKTPNVKNKQVLLVASGDLRLSANQDCWAAQNEMEKALGKAVASLGYRIVRAHPYNPKEKHGFISSQKQGMSIFARIDPKAPLIVAEAVWQYTHHVLPGLLTHRGPICTVANWSGTWPGLVGMLNLNGSLTKAGKKYSTLWAEDFNHPAFREKLKTWLKTGSVQHKISHVKPLSRIRVPGPERKLGETLAAQLKTEKAIMGIFDEGCMGMYNAIIPDELLHPTGVYKERLSQSALYYETTQVSDAEAKAVRRWYDAKGIKFVTGPDPRKHLTNQQILLQCKMYIAAMRIADDFGCATIGIQYQQGLKDLLPASDLVEGTLNNKDRPPVRSRDGKRILYPGEPLPHFNEVDECAGLDGLMIYRVHKAMGQPVENTLHDVRWGDWDATGTIKDYVWVLEISGAVPPAHLIGGWRGASSERQPGMFFRLGGGTLKGVSKPGEIVWSRVFVEDGRLKLDIGRGAVVKLPKAETERRWKLTTPQWPVMHAVTYGVSRDQFMAKHKANHIQVAYARNAADADKALLARAAMAAAMGMEVSVCGKRKNGAAW